MENVGYGDRQYTGKTGVKEVASYVHAVILGIRTIRRANRSGGGTLYESFPCGRQEISILPLWRDYALVCRFSSLFLFGHLFCVRILFDFYNFSHLSYHLPFPFTICYFSSFFTLCVFSVMYSLPCILFSYYNYL